MKSLNATEDADGNKEEGKAETATPVASEAVLPPEKVHTLDPTWW